VIDEDFEELFGTANAKPPVVVPDDSVELPICGASFRSVPQNNVFDPIGLVAFK
jgi:hypothetical protein